MKIPSIEQQPYQQALEHQRRLAFPSLGRLGELACWFAARQGKALPDDLQPACVVFAGDHGIAATTDQGVESARMLQLLASEHSPAKVLDGMPPMHLVDVGVAAEFEDVQGIERMRVAAGTANIMQEPAMSQEDYWEAVGIGEEMANRMLAGGANLLIAGDIGRGNCIAAAAVICHLSGLTPEEVFGPLESRAGLNGQKTLVAVEEALMRAANTPSHDILRELGGYEIAAMAGFYRAAAGHGVPVLLDGFASAAAAMAAAAWDVRIAGWMLASHVSLYPGHLAALEELGLEPLAQLRMDGGAALGALLVLPMLQAAVRLHRQLPMLEAKVPA